MTSGATEALFAAITAVVHRDDEVIVLEPAFDSYESDIEFARRLTKDYGVAAIPPSVFYHRRDDYKVLRFCFAKKDETLERAAEKLSRI